MCGIAGWIGQPPEDPRLPDRVADALGHRGPDGRGFRSWPQAGLIHTRLRIIDLSPAGAQPMSDEAGKNWVVFNGEIYNHRELRRGLEQHGHVFSSHADTEVLPHLYEQHGLDMLQRLRGMFAFAIWDSRRRRLLLARDRFGIKPLFYAPGQGRLSFASELNALRLFPGLDVRPDPQAIADYAALLHIPAPATFYRGIRALEPGQRLTAQWSGEGVTWSVDRWHDWEIAPDTSLDEQTAADRADAAIRVAVARQLESDAPLGALLSGGIDSSLVAAAAQAVLDRPLQTFNVRFPDAAYDETWAAVAVAEHIGSEHSTLDIAAASGTWDVTTGLLRHAGQPFADTSMFAVNAVAREMRQHVAVALSGDGGDEAFGGYEAYYRIPWIVGAQRVPGPLRTAIAGMVGMAPSGAVPARLSAHVRELLTADDVGIVEHLWSWIRPEEHSALLRPVDILPARRLFEPRWTRAFARGAGRLEKLSALTTEVNVRLILPNDYLFKVDVASMRESLEVRVPLLDEDLVEFGLTMPHRLKVRGRTAKRVLREVARRRLPEAVARKPKWGFGIPIDRWVDNAFHEHVREALLGRHSELPEYFCPAVYRPWVEAFVAGGSDPSISRAGLYQRVIMLLSLQQTLEGLREPHGMGVAVG